ncbi:MAG: Hsp70 family protein [Anaplasma sp.]
MQLLDIAEPYTRASRKAFGIDLGTTNSLIAAFDQDFGVRIFEDSEGWSLVPSVVAYSRDTVSVGHDAGSGSVLRSVKRIMGKSLSDVGSSFCGVPVIEKGAGVALDVLGHGAVTPVEVSAEILKRLAELVRYNTGQEVKQAVITVPAYFDEVARKATRDAARLAGIEVLRLLNEPTASALSYRVEQTGGTETCVIYDFGGGTFDVSVLKLHDGVFQVLATGGDTSLGGDDIDCLIAELVVGKYVGWKRTDRQISLNEDIILRARRTKEAISSGMEGPFAFEIGGDSFRCDISSAEFSGVVDKVIARTMGIVKNVVSDAGIGYGDVSKVILVGGSSKIPNVRLALDSIFRGKVFDSVDPERAVVIGAALQAHYLLNPDAAGRKVLIDVVPLSLSLEVMGGVAETIIPRNTPVPALVAQEFTTYTDGQTAIQIHVCQGERGMVGENRSLAKFDIRVPPLPAGEARVTVEFRVDMDGLLTVSARDELTGAEKCVELHSLNDITEDYIEQQVLSSVENFDADMASRELSAARLECERVVGLVRELLANGECSMAESRTAGDALLEAEAVMSSKNVQEIRDLAEKLMDQFVGYRRSG